MKADGLILIGTQKAQHFVLDHRGDLSWFTRGKSWLTDTDSITLTTKAQSRHGFLIYQLEEQRFAAWSLIISILAFLSLWQFYI